MRLKTASAIAFPLATIGTFAAVLFVAVNARGRSGWETYSTAARERGVKMSLQDFLPPAVPNAENFAAVPLFERVFTDDKTAREKGQQALSLPAEDGKPKLSAIGDAHLIDLAEWQAAFVQSKDLTAAGNDPATDVLSAIEARCGAALAELAEAERRPRSRFPVKWELGFGALLPHLQILQSASRIHQLRMAAHLAREESAMAYGEFRGALRDVRALEGEPVLISLLVRVAGLNTTLSGVWDGLIRGRWSDAELAGIETDLASLNLLADYQWNLSGERGFMNDTFTRMRASDPATLEMLKAVTNSSGPEAMMAHMARVPGYIHFNQVRLNRYFDARLECIDPVAMQLRAMPADAVDLITLKEQSSFLERAFFSLSFLTAPALENVEQSCLHGQTMIHLTRVACALERARRSDGAYPEVLDALAPKYISALPHDIITGKPLRYRRAADSRFLLYSVGMNRADEGGAIGDNANAREHPDWVWRWPERSER
ncbi:MAG TPA: hypothetical protein VFD27_13755 [Chthoniobacteraceae bacterium]|nr:hypothetical protein [Chthoniobacteraceae bacterium]